MVFMKAKTNTNVGSATKHSVKFQLSIFISNGFMEKNLKEPFAVTSVGSLISAHLALKYMLMVFMKAKEITNVASAIKPSPKK